MQIRLIKDTHADEKGNKKKKPHRGYAFVVFDREKDMRGNDRHLILPSPPLSAHTWKEGWHDIVLLKPQDV